MKRIKAELAGIRAAKLKGQIFALMLFVSTCNGALELTPQEAAKCERAVTDLETARRKLAKLAGED